MTSEFVYVKLSFNTLLLTRDETVASLS